MSHRATQKAHQACPEQETKEGHLSYRRSECAIESSFRPTPRAHSRRANNARYATDRTPGVECSAMVGILCGHYRWSPATGSIVHMPFVSNPRRRHCPATMMPFFPSRLSTTAEE